MIKRRLRKAAVVLASVALTLTAAEALLRLHFPALGSVDLDIYRKDETGRLLLRPSVIRRHVSRFWDVTIAVDEHGHRAPRPDWKHGRANVVVLGDSMSFGWGVEYEDSFPARLARLGGFTVVNASVPGTGPSDHLARLPRELQLTRPRLVVEAVFVGNDFADVAFGGADQYEVEGGLLVRRDSGGLFPSSYAVDVLRRIRLLQLLRAVQFRYGTSSGSGRPRTWDAWMREYASAHLRRPPARVERSFQQTIAAIETTAEQCRSAGAQFILLIIPRSIQVEQAEKEEMLAALGWSEDELDLDRPQRELLTWAERAGVVAVDLLEAFRRFRSRSSAPLYYSPDAHLRPSGHRIAADELAPVVDRVLRSPIR